MSTQINQNYSKDKFSRYFPEVEIVDNKIINSIDDKKINDTVKEAFKKVFEKRFANKLPGEHIQSNSINYKQIWSKTLNCLTGIAIVIGAVALAALFIVSVWNAAWLTMALVAGNLEAPFAIAAVEGCLIALKISKKSSSIPWNFSSWTSSTNPENENYKYKKFCELKGNEAVADFLDNGLSHKKFQKKYSELFEQQVMEKRDTNMLVMRDCLVMTPYQFMAKHQIPLKELHPSIQNILANK
jgi:uncharacterized integral membrane protein